MVDPVTRQEIVRLDEEAMDLGLPLHSMMENAGLHLAAVAREVADEPYLVAAGKGRNAGGGLVAARHLANAGAEVALLLALDGPDLAEATRAHLSVAQGLGLGRREAVPDGTTVLDALVGYGLDGAPRPPLDGAIDAVADASATVVALDLPSGLDATDGSTPGTALAADATVTLAMPKDGLVRGDGPDRSGQVVLADVGIPDAAYERAGLERPTFGARGRFRWTPADAPGKP